MTKTTTALRNAFGAIVRPFVSKSNKDMIKTFFLGDGSFKIPDADGCCIAGVANSYDPECFSLVQTWSGKMYLYVSVHGTYDICGAYEVSEENGMLVLGNMLPESNRLYTLTLDSIRKYNNKCKKLSDKICCTLDRNNRSLVVLSKRISKVVG